MHDYMKALYHRFEIPSQREKYLERKIAKAHRQLAQLLDKSEKKMLLRIADLEDALRDGRALEGRVRALLGGRLHRCLGVWG